MFAFTSVPARTGFASCVPKRGCSLLRGYGDSWGGEGLLRPLVSCREVSQGTCVALGLYPRFMLSSRQLSSCCMIGHGLLMFVQATPLCYPGSARCAGSRLWGYGLAGGCNLWSLVWSHGQMLTGSKGWSELSQSLLPQDTLKPAFTVTNLPGTTSTIQTAPTTSTSMQVSSGPSFPITNYLAPVSASISPNAVTSANGTVLKTTGASAVTSGGLMPIPTGFTLMSGQCL